ncbi:MAG TPA: hypothetical protein VJ971_07295 [Methylomirabilota bacterium]|nr:hypothetical protein [Methylomirabilota bacterium]
MAPDPLHKAHVDGQRLREAVDTEYRAARRDGSWGRAEPQIVERWRAAVRAWTLAVEAALGPEAATLGRFRAAPPATETVAGESAAWVELRNVLAGKVAAVAALLAARASGGSAPGRAAPPSPFRKR